MGSIGTGLGNSLNTIDSSLLQEIQKYSGTSATTGATSTSSTDSGDTVNFSQVSSLFSELQQLQTSNPAEFKQVLTDGAAKLQAAAAQQTDPKATAFLNNLAARFETAADTGNLAALNPQTEGAGGAPVQGGGHHHHHPASAAGSDSDSTSSSSDDSSSTSTSGSGTSTTGSPTSSGGSLFSFLNAAQPQAPPTLFSFLGSSNQSGQTGSDAQSALASILNSGANSTTGSQIQNALASFITSSTL
jgi:hypothetical protein